MEIAEVLALMAVAALAGTLGTMLGMGGGVFLVPMLSLLFGIPLTSAIAASAISVVANSVSGSRVYIASRFTNIRLAYVSMAPMAAGAVVGGLIATSVPQVVLKLMFATFLLTVAVLMGRRRAPTAAPAIRVRADDPLQLEGRYLDGPAGDVVTYVPRKVGLGLPVFAFGGVASGLFGIGGGPIIVPLMNLVMRVPIKAAASTSAFMVGMTGSASALIFYSRGHVDPAVTIIAMAGIIVGARLGARLATVIRPALMLLLFVVMLTLLSASMFASAAGVI